MNFIEEFYYFSQLHNEYNFTGYAGILEKKGIKWTEESLRGADVTQFDTHTVLALITAVFRADHFSDGVIDIFSHDGSLTKWLERLKEIDCEKTVEPDYLEIISFKVNIHHGIRSESLEVTQHELVITEQIGEFGKVSHRYEYSEGFIADAALCILEEMGKALSSDGWFNTDEVSQSENYIYTLTAQYEDETDIVHHGIYDRVHIPEKPWLNLVETLRTFLNIFAFGHFVNLDKFMNAMKPGEVKYCGVEFSQSGQIYHYRTTDLRISVGDVVIVPVGKENYEREVTVRTIDFCRWDDTPYPLEKTKEILRKADDGIASGSTVRFLDYETAEEDDE
jgi:hypothetical protein